MRAFAVGEEVRLLKPAGGILCVKRSVVSIPAGQLLIIKELGHENDTMMRADWKGEEVFVFREDIISATAVNLHTTVPTRLGSAPPRWTPENRPYIDVAKPAIGTGVFRT